MHFSELFTKNNVCLDASARSKTGALLKISQLLSQTNAALDADMLFDAYWKRESMGSTAIGHGIIIPHIRSELVNKTCACFVKFEYPVDFGAEDKQPIDLALGLVVPTHQTDQHLQTLRKIIIQFSNPLFRTACREASDAHALYQLMIDGLRSTQPEITTT